MEPLKHIYLVKRLYPSPLICKGCKYFKSQQMRTMTVESCKSELKCAVLWKNVPIRKDWVRLIIE